MQPVRNTEDKASETTPNNKQSGKSRSGVPSRRSILKAAGTTSLIGIAGCTEVLSGANSSKTVTVGTSVPLSGVDSPTGKRIIDSIKLGLEDAVDAGDIKDYKHLTKDSQSDVQVAQQNAIEMINNGANFLQGTVLDPAGKSIAQVGEQKNIININQGTNLWSAIGPNCYKNYFPLTQAVPCQMYTGLDYYVQKNPGASIYQIASDFNWPQSLVKYSKNQYFPNHNATNAGISMVELGKSDYSQVITKAKNSNADLVRFVAWGTDLVNMLEGAAQFGYMDDGIAIQSAAFTTTFAESMSKDIISYDKADWGMHWYHGMDNPGAKQFTKSYQKKYNRIPAMEAIHYPVTRTLMKIVGELGTTDTDKVRKEFKGRVWEPKIWGENAGVKFRSCNNQNTIPGLTAKGLPADQIDRKKRKYVKIVNKVTDTKKIEFPCSQSPCSK